MENKELQELSDCNPILFYDGVCLLCDRSVQFILKNDTKEIFRFCTLQSVVGNNILPESIRTEKLDSVILFYQRNYYFTGDAVVQSLKLLPNPYKSLGFLAGLVPSGIRNYLYKRIASSRYRWFGKSETCLIPKPQWKNRFIG